MEIVVAITGASGVSIGVRLLDVLAGMPEHRVHTLVSPGAKSVMASELKQDVAVQPDWEVDDFEAPIASSSQAPDAMVIAPCSMKTLSAVAHGFSDDLIVRTADVMLRMGRPLVLMPRETPLSLPAIENMRLAKLAGAIILPPVVAYYSQFQTLEDQVDFFVGKVLDVLGLEHNLYRRWAE